MAPRGAPQKSLFVSQTWIFPRFPISGLCRGSAGSQSQCSESHIAGRRSQRFNSQVRKGFPAIPLLMNVRLIRVARIESATPIFSSQGLCPLCFANGECFQWMRLFLLTVGSFLLTVELFYLQLTVLAFLLTVGALLLTALASLLTVGAFLLTVGKCV